MRLVVDMNLSPKWVPLFRAAGWEAVHWSDVGMATATDPGILAWAETNGYVVFTQDLDFGYHLTAGLATAPSVVLLRTQDARPSVVGKRVTEVLRRFEPQLEAGALLVLDEKQARVRLLPLKP
jgi:predicted nuclease of predicted toxin-antitoxin system